MNKIKMKVLLAGLVFLGGCTWVGTSEKIGKFDQAQNIDISASFFMIHPTDGYEKTYFTEERQKNKGSADKAAKIFYDKFTKRFGSLTKSKENMTVAEGLKTARARGDKYMITFDIHEWNSEFYMMCRSTQQPSGASVTKTDSIDISIQVYDVKTGNLLNKQRLQNSGCPTVFLNIIPVGTMGPSGRFRSSLGKWFENIK
jgi:hypothetical protein